MSLNGKSIVLTGGTRGIGSLVARELMLNRAQVLVVGRVKPDHSSIRHLQGDLSDMEGVMALASTLTAEEPDVLINLAGTQYCGPVERQPSEHIHATYMVNLVAPVLLTRSVLPAMKRRGSGHIVNIGSIFGSINYPHFATYSSAKAGLHGFTEALRREVHGSGVDVTYIAPRAVKSATNSVTVERFTTMARMKLDEPESVARQIVRALVRRRKDVFIGLPEGIFVRVNALAPRLVDVFLRPETLKARSLFNS